MGKKLFMISAATLIAVSTLWACAPQSQKSAKPAASAKASLYTGAGSSEAIFDFDYAVEFRSESEPSEKIAHAAIEEQVTYLFGPMSFAEIPAVPKENHQITNIRIEPKPGTTTVYHASYHYSGTIVVGDGPVDTYSVLLPRNPKTIYRSATVKTSRGEKYPCTDDHYDSEDDFWYFWNPNQDGCQLKLGVDYDRVQGTLKRIPNTTRTYPEYERLVNKEGRIVMSVFFGMDDEDNSKDPLQSDDINAENVRNVRRSLVDLGFTSHRLTRAELKALTGFTSRSAPYVEEFSKPSPKGTLIARISFAATGIDESSRNFHFLYKDALEHSAIVIYDGHSGLGGHLDLASIEEAENFKIRPNTDQYQIYFFNSCTSYTYYNSTYFDRKKTTTDPNGTKGLDILTNGLATEFQVTHDTNVALIRAVDAWAQGKAKTSYQELAAQIDSKNLFGVNGDEDNPTQPTQSVPASR